MGEKKGFSAGYPWQVRPACASVSRGGLFHFDPLRRIGTYLPCVCRLALSQFLLITRVRCDLAGDPTWRHSLQPFLISADAGGVDVHPDKRASMASVKIKDRLFWINI